MEKIVGVLATLLNETPEVVKLAVETDGELDKLVEKFNSNHQTFTNEELGIKIDNANRDYLDKVGVDGQQIPSTLYNRVKGNAFEKVEKVWAKEHGIESWENIDDLKRQIVEKANSGKTDDNSEALKKKDDRIKELEKIVLDNEEENKKLIGEEKSKVADRMIEMDLDRGLNSIHIDADGEKLENQKEILNSVFKQHHSFTFSEEKNRTVVLDKDGEILKNKIGEPLTVEEVLSDFAPKWVAIKEVSNGGRGGSSTDTRKSGGNLGKIGNMEELAAYAKEQEIAVGTEKFYDLMVAVQKENPDFKSD